MPSVKKLWTVEVLAADGRKRKFHEPLFVTPDGLTQAFPESPDQLFASYEDAQAGLARTGISAPTAVRTLSLPTLFRTARYQRWLAEVKTLPEGQPFAEQRLTLEETWAVFQRGGREALRKRYTRTHVAQLMARFRKEGWLQEE